MAILALLPAVHKATHRIAVFLADADLSVSQGEAHVLAHLAVHGESSINDIHHAFGHRRSTLTSILDRLEGAGLVQRVANTADRRSLLVRTTDQGAALAARVLDALTRFEADALRTFSPEQIATAAAVLAALGRHS